MNLYKKYFGRYFMKLYLYRNKDDLRNFQNKKKYSSLIQKLDYRELFAFGETALKILIF